MIEVFRMRRSKGQDPSMFRLDKCGRVADSDTLVVRGDERSTWESPLSRCQPHLVGTSPTATAPGNGRTVALSAHARRAPRWENASRASKRSVVAFAAFPP